MTREHTVAVPSSGSVVVTLNGTAWPQSKKAPLGGVAMVTVGATLPTLIDVLVRPTRPSRVGDPQAGRVLAELGVGVASP